MAGKKNKLLPWILVFLVCAIASTYIRLYPLRSHMYSTSAEQATLLVVMKLKNIVRAQVLQQFPSMPKPQQNHLIEDRFSQLLRKEKNKVRASIENITEGIAQKTPQTKQPLYLLESDPYYYYALTLNVLKTGKIAALIQGSKYFDPMMRAPLGYWQPMTWHPYFGALIYLIAHAFNPTINVMSAVSFTPLILTILSLGAFLWVCRIIACGALASLSGAMFLGLAPVFLRRSSLGWYDTDPYNLLFPLILLAIFLKGIYAKNNTRQVLFYGALYALATTLYTLFWHGWVFMFIMHLIAAAGILLVHYVSKSPRNQIGNIAILGSTIILASLVGIGVVFGLKDFFLLFQEAWGELMKFTVHQVSLWPDMFISVGELKRSTFHDIIEDTGGLFFVITSFVGLAWMAVLCLKDLTHTRGVATLTIGLMFIALYILTLKADRFSILLIMPMALFFTLAIENIFAGIKRRLPMAAAYIKSIIAIALAYGAFYTAQNNIKVVLTPIFNTAWEQALNTVKEKTPADSIINTWWSPGHFIKAIAQRRVSFDGATLNQSAMGYWISNMFLSTDENQARGILRMINTSGNKAVEYLSGLNFKLSDAVSIIKAIVGKSKTQAQVFLAPILKPSQINTLLTMTHGQAPATYVLVYNELVDANMILKFTGSWNFRLMEQLNNSPEMIKALPDRHSAAYINYLWNSVGGPPKYSEALNALGAQQGHVVFQQNITLDLTTMQAKLASDKFGHGVPKSICYLNDEGHITQARQTNATLNFSVVLYKEDQQLSCRLMDEELANSMIMKLYYFNGQGLKYFHPLVKTSDLTGRTKIKVFAVDVND